MRKTSLIEIRDHLQALEIPRDQVVIVHSSLVKFGLLEGGVAGLLDLLRDCLGPRATLVMPAFTLSFGRTRKWSSATSKSEAGAFTEFFRTRPGVGRSLHPFHSVCASGPEAERILSGHCATSFGPGSAFDRLHDLDAINLSIGTEFVGGATFLHMGEERARVPYRATKPFPGEVIDAAGQTVERDFAMYARIITGQYEYDTDWSGWWAELSSRDFCRYNHLGGALFCRWNIRETLAAFQKLLLEDPFRHTDARPLAAPRP